MEKANIKFSILITTFNRVEELIVTLNSLRKSAQRTDTEVVVCDDASTDGTAQMIKTHFPEVILIENLENKGLIHNRNVLNNRAKGEYLITLDDDANFICERPLELIEDFFREHSTCGVQAFKLFWTRETVNSPQNMEDGYKVREFVGCGHAWRKTVWNQVRNYPSWFEFYGEETFASIELFKLGWYVFLHPAIAVQHRVDLKNRAQTKGYYAKKKLALRSGWFIYFIFYPSTDAIQMYLYSVHTQIKNHGSKSLYPLFLAFLSLLKKAYKVRQWRQPMSKQELKIYRSISPNKIYW